MNTVLNLDLMRPAKGMEFRNINEFAHGAIGLGCVKFDYALKTNSFYHEFGEFTDGEFLAGTHVDMTVANLTKARNSATTSGAMISIHSTIGARTIMYRRIFLNAYDIAEVHVQQYMDGGIGHILTPEEFS